MYISHPVVIELYGLPGCGKTTLRNNLIRESYNGMPLGIMSELSNQFKRLPLYKKFQYIPWGSWCAVLRFFLSMPILSVGEWRFYKTFFTFALVYHYSQYAQGYSYIVIDHGFFQAIVSLMHGHIKTLKKKQMELFFSVIRKMPKCIFIYCLLPAGTSFERVRDRNRNVGRLDAIKNDRLLLDNLQEQKKIFDSLYGAVCAYDDLCSFVIDGERNQYECTEQLLKLIRNEK